MQNLAFATGIRYDLLCIADFEFKIGELHDHRGSFHAA
jgi:hypothetical protein